MTTRAICVLALAIALLACAAPSALASRAPFVVAYGASVDEPRQVTRKVEARGGFRTRFEYRHALRGFAADLDARQLALVRRTRGVAWVRRDRVHTAAGLVPLARGDSVPAGIRRIGAATPSAVHPSAGSSVAVLDTGVDLRNPDLNAVSGKNCIKPGTPAQDDNGHGTHVAGVAAARNDGRGVVGVAPGTRVVSVKVLDSRSRGSLSQILCGIDWVTGNAAAWKIRVANMSVAGSGADDGDCGRSSGDVEHLAICRSTAAGVTYVAAAGNARTSFAKTVPAAYPEVLTATAMTDANGLPGGGPAPACDRRAVDDAATTYSNFAVGPAAEAHTIAAPGTCVVSDALGGGTATYSGTSQAAPHVAATVALCVSAGARPGPCSRLAPTATIRRVRSDAANRMTLANGFAGDPLRPIAGRYYGPLVHAGGY